MTFNTHLNSLALAIDHIDCSEPGDNISDYIEIAKDSMHAAIKRDKAMQAELDKLRGLVKEASEYLDTNELTNIMHSSLLHKQFKAAIATSPASIEDAVKQARYIKVEADVRYWEDAFINGKKANEDGTNTPFIDGVSWTPTIDLIEGKVLDWPSDTDAFFHFKVCDAGSYFLLDENKTTLAQRLDNYVPRGLCHGDVGYGDYIIFKVGADGSIEDYSFGIDAGDWDLAN